MARPSCFRLLLALSAAPLLGLAATQSYDIPAQAADAALSRFARESRCDLLFSSDDLHREKSSVLRGNLEPEEALSRLLAGTGYTAVRTAERRFLIKKRPTAPSTIRGRILNSTGHPLQAAQVRLLPSGRLTSTDAEGHYHFEGLLSGDYALQLNAEDYHPAELEVHSLEKGGVINIESRLTPSSEPDQLAPLVVDGAPSYGSVFRRSQLNPVPRSAIGNLDLVRSEDDALPYRIYSKAQIQRSGVVNLNDFLRRELLDSDAATRPPEQDADSGGFDGYTVGSSNLRMRGYSSEETIILVNGRRLPEMLTSNRDAGPPPPDVNLIPLPLVERVEVLPISSSALYSGNPVGGVINIVLRPGAELTELSSTYSNTTGGFDAPQASFSLFHGMSLLNGRLQLQLSASHTLSVPPTESELGYIGRRLSETDDPDLLLYRATPNVRSVDNSPLFGPGTPSFSSVPAGADGNGGLGPFLQRQGLASTALFRTQAGMANSPGSANYAYGRRQERSTWYGSATWDLNPRLQLGLAAMRSNTVVNRGWYVLPGTLRLSADSPMNPFGRALLVTLNETAPQLGLNYGEGRLAYTNLTLGALLRPGGDWQMSADLQYSRSLSRYRGLKGVDGNAWQALVDSGAYNPLRDTQAYEPPKAFYDHALVFYGSRDRFMTIGDYNTIDASLRVSDRSLALPTGNGVLNLGSDYRRNQLAGFTNIQRFGDGSLAADPIEWDGRMIERFSLFGEAQLPLLPKTRRTRWLHSIELDLAARYLFSANSTERNFAPTAGLKAVLAAGFSLRGAIARTNRMAIPVMSRQKLPADPDSGGEIVPVQVFDPLRGQTYGVLSHDALNTKLHSEAAVTKSLGVVYEHGHRHRVRVSVDFTDTIKTGELKYLGAQELVLLESVLTNRVTREPLMTGDTRPAGFISSVLTGSFNLAERHSQNWINSIDYQVRHLAGGTLELNARWFYYQRYDLRLLPTSPMVNELSHPDGAAPSILRSRAFLSLGWFDEHQALGFDTHFFDTRNLPVSERRTQGSDHVASYWQCGAYVQRSLSGLLPSKARNLSLQLQLRIDNLLNAQPPRYANDSSGAGVQSYGDWRGRTYSLSTTLSF